MKILMVCLGNICRSPLAEGILAHKAKQKGLNWTIDSAGTGGWHAGELPDRRSIAVAKKYGLDITNQRARKLRSIDIDEFDVIYVMDSSNYNDVLDYTHTEEEMKKVIMIMNELHPGKNINVPDPYYNDNGFEEVYEMLDKACDKIIDKYS
jgi:protein-tyrosine phosphatase